MNAIDVFQSRILWTVSTSIHATCNRYICFMTYFMADVYFILNVSTASIKQGAKLIFTVFLMNHDMSAQSRTLIILQ